MVRLSSTDSQRSPPASPFHQSPMKHDPPHESHAPQIMGCLPLPTRGDGSGRHHSSPSPTTSRPAAAAGHVAQTSHKQVQEAQEAARRGAVGKAGRRLELGGLSSPRSPARSTPCPPHQQQSVPAAVSQRYDAARGSGGVAKYADDASDACQTPLPRQPLRTRPYDSPPDQPSRDDVGVDDAWSGERVGEPRYHYQQEGQSRAAARPRSGSRAGPAPQAREHPSRSASAGISYYAFSTQMGMG